MLAPPAAVELVNEMCMVFVVFTVTLPKSRLDALRPTWVDACVPVPLVVLGLLACDKLQPEKVRAVAIVRTAMAIFCQWRGGVILSRITCNYLDRYHFHPES